MQFKQDDKVVCTLNGQEGEVQFGPVKSVGGKDAYLVKWGHSGASSLVLAEDLRPAPRFKVGQKVTFSSSEEGDFFELVAGPFPNFLKNLFWVIKDEDGDHEYAEEKSMIPAV